MEAPRRLTHQERAIEVFQKAGYRCCVQAEFTVWYVGAQEVGSNGCFYSPNSDPGSARNFCLECHPLAQQEMAAQGRCVRLDMADPGARERMQRFRDRQKAAVT